jgi:hypothetical protein
LARRLLTDRQLRREVVSLARSWRRATGGRRGHGPGVRTREMLASQRIEHLARRLPGAKRRSRLPIASVAGAAIGSGALAVVAMLRRRGPAVRGTVHVLGRKISGEVRMKKAA